MIHYKKINGKYKRRRGRMDASLNQPVYLQKSGCKCDYKFNFTSKTKNKKRRKMRLKKKFGAAAGFSKREFRENWKRKMNDEWNVNISLENTDLQNETVKIECN